MTSAAPTRSRRLRSGEPRQEWRAVNSWTFYGRVIKDAQMATRKKLTITDDHKAALAAGRAESRSVRLYLEALAAGRPRRGRKRSPDTIRKRLTAISRELDAADPLRRVHLLQEQMDCEQELLRLTVTHDLSALEAEFVKAAKGYSRRKGISYAAWRAAGVDASVLAKAGITRED